jgi:hypothetical protein
MVVRELYFTAVNVTLEAQSNSFTRRILRKSTNVLQQSPFQVSHKRDHDGHRRSWLMMTVSGNGGNICILAATGDAQPFSAESDLCAHINSRLNADEEKD